MMLFLFSQKKIKYCLNIKNMVFLEKKNSERVENMKCEKCGHATNPGDQICINCGSELSLQNLYIPKIDQLTPLKEDEEKKTVQKKKNIVYIVAITIILIVFILTIFTFIKR